MNAELELTQRWLALEHEAIWTLGVIGARVEPLREAATSAITAHRARRDRIAGRIASLGVDPVGVQPAYAIVEPNGRAAARALMLDVERRIAAACVRLVAVTADDARELAVRGLRDAATAQLRWGGAPEPFPGLD